MAYEMLGRCPVCSGQLRVARLTCGECGTSIEGQFDPCKFCKLTRENRQFAETFIRCRGNIKEVEKELNISYPTVRSRLENLITALESDIIAPYPPSPPQPADDQNISENRMILESLDRGELNVAQALKLLRRSSHVNEKEDQ